MKTSEETEVIPKGHVNKIMPAEPEWGCCELISVSRLCRKQCSLGLAQPGSELCICRKERFFPVDRK